MDKKTRFFKNVILFQFGVIVLAIIFVIMKYETQDFVTIEAIHPYEFNFGLAAPLIFFGSSLILSFPFLFAKQRDFEEDKTLTLKRARIKSFWKFAFYSNISFLVLLSILGLIINLQSGQQLIIEGGYVFYICVFMQAIIILFLSLIVATLMLSSGIYWKTIPALAIGTSALGLVFVVSWIFIDYIVLNEFKRMSDISISMQQESDFPVETTVVEMDSDDSGETDEDSMEEEDEAGKLENAWDYFIHERYDLKGKEAFTEVRFPMFSNFFFTEAEQEDDDHFLADYISEIRKDPESITDAFQIYKYILFSSISSRTYRISNFDKVVDGLFVSYYDLKDEKGKLNSIYKIMSAPREGYDLDAGQYYPEIESYFSLGSIQTLENYRLSNGTQFSNGDIVWFYSFWARRNHENNMDEVAAILKEIQENYN